jgi:V/A-type H+-transporting ATPase subunit K
VVLSAGEPRQLENPLGKKEAFMELEKVLIAFSAALAIGIPALATGWAQSRIGAAGAGTLAEKPEMTGTIIILVAIPETMVILGFVVATMILFMVK